MALPRRPLTTATALPAALALAAALALPSVARAQTADAPEVALVTVGPGDDVFSRFGHAALCVRDPATPQGRCYNYGTADFTTPAPLTWAVLRGRGRFWVSVVDEPAMVAHYARVEDRTVWRQVLALPPEARRRLADRLAWDALPAHRHYVYHHYRDNCTTRLRDHLDAVSERALSPARITVTERSWRDRTREGFASDLRLLGLAELLLGSALDAPMNRWEEMFLPSVLREEVARALSSPAVAVSTRARPLPEGESTRGLGVLIGFSAIVSLLGLLGGSPRPRLLSLSARALTALLLAVPGLAVWSMVIGSTLPELRHNAVALVLVPTDLALAWPSTWRRYGRARLVLLVLVVLGWCAGWFAQSAVGVLSLGALLAVGALTRSERARPTE